MIEKELFMLLVAILVALLIVGLLILFSVILDFLIETPKQLKRIANSLEKGIEIKIEK